LRAPQGAGISCGTSTSLIFPASVGSTSVRYSTGSTFAHPVRELDSPDEALAEVGGVNVHVGSAIDGRDRKRLERLCRYMARPPVCQERLEVTGAGQVVVRFKRAWRSGAHGVVLDPLDFIARLVALIPPPHFNMLRYYGVFAARAKVRSEVVPGPTPQQPEPVQLQLALEGELLPNEGSARPAPRHPWAWLLQRVFAVDIDTAWPARVRARRLTTREPRGPRWEVVGRHQNTRVHALPGFHGHAWFGLLASGEGRAPRAPRWTPR
jgi:hypothetical protein